MDDILDFGDKSDNFATFRLFLGNLTLPVSMFFIRFILPEATDR